MNEQRITVPDESGGERLDRYLARTLQRSRSSLQRLIKEGLVTVNGRAVIAHHPLRAQDVIVIAEPALERRHETLTPTVIDETPEFLVLEKPAGLLTHPTPTRRETTLSDWIVERYPEVKEIGEHERPGIVHRLDRDVSGLLVVARTPVAFKHLQDEFRHRRVKKTYTALVVGSPQTEEGDIRFRIARSRRRRGRMAARPEHAEGKEALTRFEVLERFRHTTLLAVHLVSGRTHQIRAHLFALGLPIVGDRLYKGKRSGADTPDPGRLFLHASKLGFSGLDGAWHEYTSPLPASLSSLLDELRKGHSAAS